MSEAPERPSIVLQGFRGGVVNSAEVALRLAPIILESLIGPNKLATCLPLLVDDLGDRWSITSANGNEASVCRIEIRKRDAAIVSLGVEHPLAALGSGASAEKFAAVLAEAAGGVTEANRQSPLLFRTTIPAARVIF